MKGQALADFVVECTIPPHETEAGSEAIVESCPWVIHVDDSANKTGSGAGIVLESPNGLISKYALRLIFKASNNVAEYEAVIASIDLARVVSSRKLHIKSHSRFMVGQVTREF